MGNSTIKNKYMKVTFGVTGVGATEPVPMGNT